MIGQRIQSRPGFPWLASLLLIVVAFLVTAGVMEDEPNLYAASLLPAAIAVALLASREPNFSAEFSEVGLEVDTPNGPRTVPYETIERVWTRKRKIDPETPGPEAYAIGVGHQWGAVIIPRKIDVPSDDVYRFLHDQVPTGGTEAVNEELAEYLAEQVAEFGPDRVRSYRASPRRVRGDRRRWRAVSLAVVLVGIAWIVFGSMGPKGREGWIAAGAVMLFYSGVAYGASFAAPGRLFKGWQDSSLVVGPLGLALVQGDVRGEMKWDELRDVRLTDTRSFRLASSHAAGRGVLLKVEGATILVPDIYDRPIYKIYEVVSEYWQ